MREGGSEGERGGREEERGREADRERDRSRERERERERDRSNERERENAWLSHWLLSGLYSQQPHSPRSFLLLISLMSCAT